MLYTSWLTRISVAGALSITALALSGCSTDTAGPETGVDVEDVHEGAEGEPQDGEGTLGLERDYDDEFFAEIESLDGQEVTVSAKIDTIVNDQALTIAGTDDTTVDPLLIIHGTGQPELEEGEAVVVTGEVHYVFNLPVVEESMGLDLNDDDLGEWDLQPYIAADTIDPLADEE